MSETHLDPDAARRLGELIRQARRTGRKPLTQQQLAKRAGLSRETISRIECGREPYPATLIDVAVALELELDLTIAAVGEAKSAFPRLGMALRERRKRQGLSLEQCAEIAAVSAGALSRFERGKACKRLAYDGTATDPYQGACVKYSEALGFASPRELNAFFAQQKRESGPLDESTVRAIRAEAEDRRRATLRSRRLAIIGANVWTNKTDAHDR